MRGLSLRMGLSRKGAASASNPYAGYTYAVDRTNNRNVFEGTEYASLAAMPGYNASPLYTNDPTLTDQDMLIMASVTLGLVNSTTQFIFNNTNDAGNSRILLYVTPTNAVQITISAAGAASYGDNVPGVASRVAKYAIRRLSGVWSFWEYTGGVLTQASNNSGDNSFPSSALMTKAAIGEHTDGSLDFTGTVHGIYIRAGTFGTSGAIQAALDAVA